MAGRELDSSELAAADIVASFLDGRVEERDIGGAHRTHDFDIHVGERQVVALEVTAAADDEVLSLDFATFKERREPKLATDWWVVLTRRVVQPPVRVNDLVKKLVPVLAELERQGVTEVGRRGLPGRESHSSLTSEAVRASDQLAALGASFAQSHGERRSPSGGEIVFSLSNGFGSDIARVNVLVTQAADANHEKLKAATADERHLFVWLHHSHSGAELAVSTGLPLQTPPALPESIDVVWLATRGLPDADAVRVGEVGVLRLWRVRPPRTWERLPLRRLERDRS